jgi:hypothetical protein
MIKQLPFKKEYLLLAATMVLLLLSYQLAFKKTINAWQLNSSLKQQLTRSTDVSFQPGYQERKNANLDQIIHLYQVDTSEFRSSIISTIAEIAGKENVKLSEVPTGDPAYHTSQFIIQRLRFEGDYFLLEKVLNRLRSVPGVGIIRSAQFKSTKNEKTKKLLLEVYFEILNK